MVIKQKGGQDGEQYDDEGDEKRKRVCRNVVNFFFTNFPPEWNKANLHDLFVEVREISDVYVARKLTKAGKRFGFARFFRIGNLQALEKRLHRIRIGSFRLEANIAKFEKTVSMSKQGFRKEGWVLDMASKSNHLTTHDHPSSTIHTGVHTTTDSESLKIHSLVELESIWFSLNATYCKVMHIGGSKFSLEFENKQDVYTSTRNDFEKGVKDEVDMSNDDGSNLVGGGLCSNPDKADEPTTGHVNDGDTPTKDGNGESDDSYASTFPAQGCKKENSKFEMDHVSPYMDDVEHVNDHCTSQGIEATERSLSSQLGGQVGSSKPRPTKIELEKIVAYSRWLNENDSIKCICEGFISRKYASSSHGNNTKHSHSTFTKRKTCGVE
uniref:Nucleotide-binding alpha-beta plait domain-containing protein n=1 Tax=Tanacetum cinerariifolium TaxID=118510 RepID=A0A6L2JB34_TANCI|nr:nucleotide-binding alpha-beta plait domain-containing protein [Tanacetum cinerariifolium]